ncbi:autotransporter domain-containing protein [Oricola sp.]|uniref:autotransporter outer membrane beta-barrel domain-containing protein n=1 Tax=Oricola sp. TaxID=1979950 RepID=UPI0025FB5B95|nr:autotransporter domain-containing protein [Oricola sp.]MCI5075591.1 autotransporter domain-containing protein [Oricola sp.]
MTGSRKGLQTWRAIGVVSVGLVSLALAVSVARAADLPVSAGGSGATHEVSGSETYGIITVGIDSGESGTVQVGTGDTLNTGIDYGASVIGVNAGSTGTVYVEGADATWIDTGTDSAIIVGQNGVGKLDVGSGGLWQTQNVRLGAGATGIGTVTISGEDTLWQNAAYIHIGYEEGAQSGITVSDGAKVETAHTNIGTTNNDPEASPILLDGSLTLTGEDTHWVSRNGGQIARTNGATGSLSISDGATFETVSQGLYTGAGSQVTVTGEGTQLLIGTEHSDLPGHWDDADGWFAVDGGTVLISGGALLDADGTHVSSTPEAHSVLTVTGEGTRMVNNLSLYVGGGGNPTGGYGKLTISDGATASAYTVAAGTDLLAEGIIIITGEGSRLDVLSSPHFSGNVRAGYEGDGTIIVQEGGVLKNANILDIASLAGSTGVLVIGAEEGESAVGAGTVEAANGVFFGEGDATLVFNHTGEDYVFANVISSTEEPYTGHEIRHVAGVTDLTADSPDYSGTIAVLGGTLKANGDLSGAQVTVGDGGTLGGSGSIMSLVVQSGGTVAPGNSPGTMTVYGDTLFETGSTYDVEFDGLLSDRILVEADGNVTIEDQALLNAVFSSDVVLDNPYQIITLGSGSTGEIFVQGSGFTLPDEDYALLEGALDYGTDEVTLTFQGVSDPWSMFVSTPNQGAAADAVQALGGGNPVYFSAMFLEEDELDDAFDLLSGEIHASAKTALIADSQLLRGAVMDRITDIRKNDGFWATGFGNWGSIDGDGNAASADHDTAGMFIGSDRRVGDWQVGFLAGYSNSDVSVDERASSAQGDNYHLGLYAGGDIDMVRVRAALSHSWHDMATTRMATLPEMQSLTADYDATTTQVFGELGVDLGAGDYDWEPFAGLAHVNLNTDGYVETGGDAALTSGSTSTDLTFTTLGLRGSASLGGDDSAAVVTGAIGWRHAFGDVTPTATHGFGAAATPFTVSGVPVEEDAALADVKLNLRFGDNVNVHVGYRGEFGADTTVQSAQGGLNVRF